MRTISSRSIAEKPLAKHVSQGAGSSYRKAVKIRGLLGLHDLAILVVTAARAHAMRKLGFATLRAHGTRSGGNAVVGAAAAVDACTTLTLLRYCHVLCSFFRRAVVTLAYSLTCRREKEFYQSEVCFARLKFPACQAGPRQPSRRSDPPAPQRGSWQESAPPADSRTPPGSGWLHSCCTVPRSLPGTGASGGPPAEGRP